MSSGNPDPPDHVKRPLGSRIRLGVLAGLGFAAGFTILAIPFALLRWAAGSNEIATSGIEVSLPRTLAVYVVGGVLGGGAVGALWPLRQLWAGRRVLGVVAALPVMFAVRILIWGPGGWRMNWSFYDARLWLLTSVIYGFVMSFGIEDRKPRRRRRR
jgi:hypothetical protein